MGTTTTPRFAALEAALAVSPSSAITYIVGGVMFGWAGEAERAIEWGERAMRLSPFDPWAWSAFHAFALGHFHRGRYEEAARAARKAVQLNPGHSISYMLLVAPLAKLGRLEGSRGRRRAGFGIAAGLSLQPTIFRRRLRARPCRIPGRGAARRRPAGIASRPMSQAMRARRHPRRSAQFTFQALRLV